MPGWRGELQFGLFIARPILGDRSQSLVFELAALTYPAVDVIALVASACLLAQVGDRLPAARMMALSAFTLALADGLLSLGQLEARFPAFTATASNLLYDVSFIALGYAVLIWKTLPYGDGEQLGRLDSHRIRVATLTVVPLLVPTSLLAACLMKNAGSTELQVTVAASVLTFVLTTMRMAMLVRSQRDTAVELDQALCDLREQSEITRQAQKMEAVGRLAGGVAHEINTPIQFIGQNLEFIQSAIRNADVTDVDVNEAIVDSLAGVRHVSDVVAAMRTFGHPGSEFDLADVNELLLNAMTIAGSSTRSVADVETRFSRLPQVLCSPSDLQQVFLNLLTNSADAIAETRRRGTITLLTLSDGDHVVISVSDDGIGIDDEVRSRVFDPMYTTKSIGKGSGVGLTLVWSSIVDQHGGTVECKSTPGAGTCFTLRIPVAEPNLDRPASALAMMAAKG